MPPKSFANITVPVLLRRGRGAPTTPPLLQGDFIWYSLDPDTGFLNKEGLRYINDEGSTAHILPAGGDDD